MKPYLLTSLILLYSLSVAAQLPKKFIDKNENNRYSIQYIDNVYSRAADVIGIIGRDFLKQLKNTEGEITIDSVNNKITADIVIKYKANKRACFKAADLVIKTTIYYKDQRTKIVFDDMRYRTEEGANGKLESLENARCTDASLAILYAEYMLKQIGYYDYKDYIKKRQRDPKLF